MPPADQSSSSKRTIGADDEVTGDDTAADYMPPGKRIRSSLTAAMRSTVGRVKNLMIGSPQRPVWFQLADSATGKNPSSADKVTISSSADIADFRDAVKAENTNKLSSVNAADLLVYKNMTAFEKRNVGENPLDSILSIGVLGSKEDMLVVVVPSAIPIRTELSGTPEALEYMPSLKHHQLDGLANVTIPLNDSKIRKLKELPEIILRCNAFQDFLRNINTVGDRLKNCVFPTKCLTLRLDRRYTSFVPNTQNNIKIMLGPSGCGKTRTCLEVLFKRNGIYLTCQESLEFGSGDLYTCIENCYTTPGNATLLLKIVLFIRQSILHVLLSVLHCSPKQILFAQLYPQTVFGYDLFKKLFLELSHLTNIVFASQRNFILGTDTVG